MSGNIDAGHKQLVNLAQARIPFDKDRGCRLIELPKSDLVWFASQGFPDGQLGRWLQAIYEIKLNGLEALFRRLRQLKSGFGIEY
ncbi:MAG: DUF3820 family protein [Desulfuromonadales bacterium]